MLGAALGGAPPGDRGPMGRQWRPTSSTACASGRLRQPVGAAQAQSALAGVRAPTRDAYAARLKQVVEEINRSHEVEGLCRSFLARIAKLVENKGGRLSE